MSDSTPLLSSALSLNQTSPSSDWERQNFQHAHRLSHEVGIILQHLSKDRRTLNRWRPSFVDIWQGNAPSHLPILTIHPKAHEAHKAFTLTQKRRARDKMAKCYNKFVDAEENVWPRNTGSIPALVRRTRARTGIIGNLAPRFVVPAKTKYQKRARKSAKRMQSFEKELLRKVNDPADAMDMEHAIQELCDTSLP
ncbi:hypothetical protein LRP88_00687 [Fusarium phalaenopsidis]